MSMQHHNHEAGTICSVECPVERWGPDDTHSYVSQIGRVPRGRPLSADVAAQAEQQATDGESIVDARRGIYGDPTLTYIRVAQIISAIIDHEVSAAEAALIQVAVKLVRTAETPDYSDNSDDIIGYMKMFQEIVGDDMIHAKSVGEYLALKQERDS